MVRWALIAGFLLVSIAILVASYLEGTETPAGDLMVNLGAEVMGIVITLAVVDWLLERRRLQDRAREVAWSVLHSVERAVWIWQGGSRRPEPDELLGLVAGIDPDGRLADGTRTLLVNVGAHAREVLNRERRAVRTLSGLEDALNELTGLHSLTDGRSAMEASMAGEMLSAAVEVLVRVTGGPTQPIPAGLVRGRDPTPEAQERRLESARVAAPLAGEWGALRAP